MTPAALCRPGLLVSALLAACNADMPRPRYVGQTTASLRLVAYPPPPARVEFVPARPPGRPVWVDGEWTWSGSEWSWTAGRWVVSPAGASFAPWTTVRDERGNVYYANGVWKNGEGQEIAAPLPLA